MKTVNLIFSILFLLWCVTILIICNSDSTAKNGFHYGFEEFNFFWELVILATFCNILARIFDQCTFYLAGAFGLLALFFTQLISFIFFIKNFITGYSIEEQKVEHVAQLITTVVTFPYIIFGILSSMCCYQTIIHQRIDRTQSKFQQLFLQIPLTNYQNIILLFNVMVSLSAVTLFFITFIESEEFKYSQLVRLFPIIPTILFFLALRSGEKFLYRLTMISWGTFTVLFIISFCTTLIYMINQQQKNFSDSIEALPLFLIFVLRGVIGFLSTLSVLCKIEKKEREFENNFDSKNFISLDYLKVNHRLEKPLLVKIYPKLPTSEVAERMSLLHG